MANAMLVAVIDGRKHLPRDECRLALAIPLLFRKALVQLSSSAVLHDEANEGSLRRKRSWSLGGLRVARFFFV